MMRKFVNCFSCLFGQIPGVFGRAYLPFCSDYLGLGNRLKGLCNFYARGYRKFVVLWNTKCWVTERWDTLFELPSAQMRVFHPGDWLYSFFHFCFRRFSPTGIVREEMPFWSFILPPELRREEFKHRWHFSPRPTYSVDWWFDRTPDDVKAYFLPFFNSLKPSKRVQERIKTCHLPENAIGVQIRNTDNRADIKDVASLDSMFAVMERFPTERPFFVSCMTADVSKAVRRRFGARVIELDNKDCHSMVDAVADMWLLGQCTDLIASPESTFSEVAWWWGGCRSKVTMLTAEYNQGFLDSVCAAADELK